MDLKTQIQQFFHGDILDDAASLEKYSQDASIFKIKPQIVLAPKDTEDIKKLVQFVNSSKEPLSITPRAAGTCMSGGAINDSIILDMTKYFNKLIKIEGTRATVQPGMFYRDFEKETLKQDLLLPCYTSSRELNTVGGMVGNNSAGEKTLSFGQTERYVKALKAVLTDGNEYKIYPLTKEELDKKIAQKDFEGNLYKYIWDLVSENDKIIKAAEPTTSKNSTGYLLWKVWDGQTFDLTKLLVGSQGTLGIVTEIEFELVHPKKHSYTVIMTLHDLQKIDLITNEVLKFSPESFECFDDATLKAAVKYLSEVMNGLKNSSGFSSFLKLIPEYILKFTNKYPPLILLAEFTGDSDEECIKKGKDLQTHLTQFGIKTQLQSTVQAEKYWIIRRQSFNLLRLHTKGMRTAPFFDDIIVHPKDLPQFLPLLNKILEEYKDRLIYTLAGHIGNGNFHIIPLMDFNDKKSVELIPEVAEKVFDLVFQFKGSMAAEHNDGLVRGPFLDKMYGETVYQLFKEVKDNFDPKDIFNPHKKVDATWEYSLQHISSDKDGQFPMDYINK